MKIVTILAKNTTVHRGEKSLKKSFGEVYQKLTNDP